ncbi:MAG: TonB-dependent receptor domain-containing protein, partial [Pseudomonadales bacterium]
GSDIDSSGVSLTARSNDPDFAPDAHPRDNNQYSQEFQFIGDAFNERLQYVAGLYYFAEKTEDSVTFGIAGGPFFAANLGASDLYFARNSGTGLDTDNEAFAAFLQTDWSLTDSLKLTAGVRYTTEDRELARTRYVPILETYSNDPSNPAVDSGLGDGLFFLPAGRPELLNPIPRLTPAAPDVGDISNDDWTPMLSLQYLFEGGGFIDGGTAYVTYSEGFRSGGLSEGPADELERFDPETVTNIEVGLKLDAWNNRLRANFALFNADYDDRQLTTIVVNPDNGSIAGRTINAAKSTIRGVEAEITLLPIENLQLTLNLALNDGEIKEYDDVQLTLFDITTPVEADSLGAGCIDTGLRTRPPAAPQGIEQCDIDRSDENLPRLPDQTIFLAAQYFIETDIGTFVPRVSYSQKDNIDACFDRNSCLSGLAVFDHKDVSARVTWLSNDGSWRVAVYGTNLTDEDFGVGGTALTDFTGTAGVVATVPRMYGAELEFTW